MSNDLRCRPDYTKHSSVRRQPGQIILLYGSERFGRRGITGKDNQGTSLFKKPFHTLQRILVNGIKRSVSIRRSCIIAKVDVIISGQFGNNFLQDGKTTIARIENANGSNILHKPNLSVVKGFNRPGMT